jgi:release factor glutamine methyltransferase
MAEKVQTIKEILHTITQMFGELYPPEEAKSIASTIVEEFTGMNRIHQIMDGDNTLSAASEKNITDASSRVAEGEPLQYVIGYTVFCGHRFEVNRDVLIPRPETEEMTSLVIMENPGFAGSLTDYCTGSGCVAVSLALAFPSAIVHATDISSLAIDTAKKNAANNSARVQFSIADLFISNAIPSDIIVSNPPYVMEKEKRLMRPNVTDHEPHLALFVPDNDPLLYYRTLALIAGDSLSPEGRIYLEINEALGKETMALFTHGGFKNVHVIKDLSGKDRILTAHRNGRKE